MEHKKFFQYIFIGIFLFSFFAVLSVAKAFAAGGSISVDPQNGSYKNGDSFEAAISIDGGGNALNAAKADISISENIRVDKLTLGDCGFAFVDTPTTTSLSFAGVILGGSTQSCVVYKLTLKVVGSNNGFITVSGGSIKSYEGAKEIFSNVNNGSYQLSESGNVQNVNKNISPIQPPILSINGEKMYTVIYTVDTDTARAQNLTVFLDPDLPTQMQTNVSPLLQDRPILAAVFDNVPEGVHTIEVREKDSIVSSEVVNLQGDNREISLGVEPKISVFTPANIAFAAVGLIAIIIAVVIGYIFYWKKKHPTS